MRCRCVGASLALTISGIAVPWLKPTMAWMQAAAPDVEETLTRAVRSEHATLPVKHAWAGRYHHRAVMARSLGYLVERLWPDHRQESLVEDLGTKDDCLLSGIDTAPIHSVSGWAARPVTRICRKRGLAIVM
jgi:hypothetical protein